ncbi:MAG: hypothetical protein OHK0013_03440 [Sandaracinaceae bacterium]
MPHRADREAAGHRVEALERELEETKVRAERVEQAARDDASPPSSPPSQAAPRVPRCTVRDSPRARRYALTVRIDLLGEPLMRWASRGLAGLLASVLHGLALSDWTSQIAFGWSAPRR